MVYLESNYIGLVIGFFTFLIIGLFHPLVIKAEYYMGTKSWIVFLVMGLLAAFTSLMTGNRFLSILLGVIAFSSLWSIHEVIQQKKRVEKGWFPANPKRKKSVK